MEIQGKIAVVTGAASGIGRATGIALANEGASVVLSDINQKGLEELRAQLAANGKKVMAKRADVTKLGDIQNLFSESLAKMGRVDILMNNAGVHITGPIDKISVEDWEWIMAVNLWSVIYGVQVFLPHMLERGSGHIVNTASLAGLFGGAEPDSIPYTVTKFGVFGFSEGLSVALRAKGIGVTAICPGFVGTDIGLSQRLVESGDQFDEARQGIYRMLGQSLKEGTLQLQFPEGDEFQTLRVGAKVVTAEAVAQMTVRAIKENNFQVCTHPGTDGLLAERASDLEGLLERQSRATEHMQQMVNRALAPPTGGKTTG